jgi:hypothetical protein
MNQRDSETSQTRLPADSNVKHVETWGQEFRAVYVRACYTVCDTELPQYMSPSKFPLIQELTSLYRSVECAQWQIRISRLRAILASLPSIHCDTCISRGVQIVIVVSGVHF